jgi:uncharacterized protein
MSSTVMSKILPGIELIDLAIWLPEQKLLALSDTHIGYEEALTKRGVLLPRFQFKDLYARMKRIIDTIEKKSKKKQAIECILINGDLKHEFGRISDQEWRETLQFLDLLLLHAPRVVLVKGNHDTILGPIARKRKVELVQHFQAGSVLFMHGHELPKKDLLKKTTYQTLVIGNEHPAISVGDTVRRETYKCFLKGLWKRKNFLVLPSFNTLTEGTDMLQEKYLSPFFAARSVRNSCEVWVFDAKQDKHLFFGKLSTLRA